MTDSLPSHAQAVVIGGGIMGCSTLYHPAKLGVHEAILLTGEPVSIGLSLSPFYHPAGARMRAEP